MSIRYFTAFLWRASGAVTRFTGGRDMAMAIALLLVLEHLAIELVRKCVDRRVHVRLDAFGVDFLAAHMQIGRYLLPELVDREHDIDVDYMVEVPGQTHELGRSRRRG